MKVIKIACIVCIAWVVLAVILPCGGGQGLARLASLRSQAKEMQGRLLNESELRDQVGGLHLDFRTTRYVPAIHFNDHSQWVVKLTPDKRRAFINSMPLWYRFMVMDFRKMDYPDIEIRSK
jgi:hypothetical protein